jgi:uncharacterized protein
MYHDNPDLPMRQRILAWLEHLAHILPAQAPIRDFVHHNTLHGFQHLPFAEALAAAHQLTGANPYWPESRFLAEFAAGRITRADLRAALHEAGITGLSDEVMPGISAEAVLLASLLPGTEMSAAEADSDLELSERVFGHLLTLTAVAVPADPAAANWADAARQRWQAWCAGLGHELTLRQLLLKLTGEDVLEQVRTTLQRHLAAHLDMGVAAWRNPAHEEGFYRAWRASAGHDLAWELAELPNVINEVAYLPDDAFEALLAELERLLPDETLWLSYLERLALEIPGWAGMFLWRDHHPLATEVAPVNMIDYLAVRVLLEYALCEDRVRRLTGVPMPPEELCAYFSLRPAEFVVREAWQGGGLAEDLQHRADQLVRIADQSAVTDAEWQALAEAIAVSSQPAQDALARQRASQLQALWRSLGRPAADLLQLAQPAAQALLAAADRLTGFARSQVWLLAYEGHYREQIFSALAANHARHQRHSALPPALTAQVVCCMDDREEGTRRHLEELAPTVATYGAAGFFGVAMYWQGLDDAARSAQCPIVVTPAHQVSELPVPGAEGQAQRHARRRRKRLRWRERLYQSTRRDPLRGPVMTALAALPAMAALTAGTLFPGWFGSAMRRWRVQFDGPVKTALALNAEALTTDSASEVASPDNAQAAGSAPVLTGFSDGEQVDRVEAFLRTIGLTRDFAPLVLMLGHGSGSRNNPHLSAYDCGACSGRHGGPNARVFASMANRPAVRAALAGRGIAIPDNCWFLAGEHNTCDDSIEWYDLDAAPASFQTAIDTLVGQLGEACRAHAAERCRRLASAPPKLSPWPAFQHVRGRLHDISQARPELGHATNAAAFIGRRAMSQGLFLDRRVFLISYDPMSDLTGQIVESILLAAGPVGAGISLEYYFSTVDNERFGCGSKITHNITGLFGVMEGADSDLRTGLPWQMVEIHEPMRLLVVVEQTPAVLSAILERQPALAELFNNAWMILVACDPSTAAISRYCPRRGWLPWQGGSVLPQVARSHDWFAGEREALAPALLLGGVV